MSPEAIAELRMVQRDLQAVVNECQHLPPLATGECIETLVVAALERLGTILDPE